jgi:predicted PurR-regulated permease PerM
MTENIKDTPSTLLTSETTQKVPDEQNSVDWPRYALIFAFALPFLISIGFGIVKVLGAILAVIPPFAVAFLLALLLDPLVDRMEKRGLHRAAAVSIVFGSVFTVLIITGIVAIPAIVTEASSLASNSATYMANTKVVAHNVNSFLAAHPRIWTFHLPKAVHEKTIRIFTAKISTQVTSLLQTSSGEVAGFLVGSVSTLFDLIITMIVGFYLLIDIDRIRARFFFFAPEKYRKKLAQMGVDIGQVFSDYLRGLVTVCLLYGLTTILVLYGLAYMPKYGHDGMAQYALLIGASAGVLYAIPYLGAISIGLVTFLVALWAGGPQFAFISVIAILLINQVFDNVVVPRVIGGGVGLNPVVAIFALTLGGYLFGFWGLLLSVPVAASIQVVLFRLIPKLVKPTPPAFLEAHGVPSAFGAGAKIMNSGTEESKDKRDEEREQAEVKLEKDIKEENAEAKDLTSS